ncbi:MGMT family protein [Actinotignum urinale]|uniref:methylated-DNA--[protein]-cysteine S-methyltransferase n=1 Tax=Actinotignum urinale TaxID=190146 RepID=UPI002A83EC16|nr:MGMT family protein [Actinotignum urinale]MDY5151920.1 MGMT family protein [Actinotignum urinale]
MHVHLPTRNHCGNPVFPGSLTPVNTTSDNGAEPLRSEEGCAEQKDLAVEYGITGQSSATTPSEYVNLQEKLLNAGTILHTAQTQLAEYFTGKRRIFTVPLDVHQFLRVPRQLATNKEQVAQPADIVEQAKRFLPEDAYKFTLVAKDYLNFTHRAQLSLSRVPYGKTATYKDIAGLAGNPKAVRATGTGCASNLLPIFLPCHRIIRSDGDLGNYGGGVDMKRELLTIEGYFG